nr:putative reverse transcriptase domain-containing protein [Tanacetum cinerariifolium]
MRQHHWIELFSNYDCEIRYHPGKANIVADALSSKERVKPKRVRAMNMTLQSSIKDRILAAQKEASDEFAGLHKGLDVMVELRNDGALYYPNLIWVPLKSDVRTLIIDEAYKSKYYVHPRADKMYYDLRDRYWWPGMKKDIAVYVSKCLTCLNVKAEHQRPSGLLQQHKIPEWNWKGIAMDFVTKLPRTCSGHDTIWVIVDRLTKSAHFIPMRKDYKRIDWLSCVLEFEGSWDVHLPLVEFLYNIRYHSSVRCALFEALYGRKCRSLIMWAEVGEGHLIRPELVQETTEKISQIKDRLKAKCLADPTLQVPLDEIRVDDKLNFVEEPVEIVEREFKKLKHSRITIVKKTCNNDKNLSEIQLEHKKEDEFVAVVVRVAFGGSRGESLWEEGGDFGVVVLRFHTCLTNILGFLEKLELWLSKTLMMKERRTKKVKVVVKYDNLMI